MSESRPTPAPLGREAFVVGAGPGGLAAAILLAGAGVRVRLFERLPTPGGRASRIETEGFRFDTGPTFFLYPRILREILASVGRDLDKEIPMVRLDPQYRLVFGAGGTIDATADVARMQAEIAKLNARDAEAFPRFLAENRVKFERFEPCLHRPFESWRDVLSWHMLRLLPVLRPWLPLERELGRLFEDPRVRLAFTFQSKYLGMSPFQCPSLFSILSFLEYEHGVYHPIGGCTQVMHALHRIAAELGVEFRFGDEVEELLVEGGRIRGLRSVSGIHRCDTVVLNADFARAMHRLLPSQMRKRWTDERIGRSKFSCSTFMLYLGVDGSLPELRHHTIYMARDYAKNLAEIAESQVLSEDPSFYVQNACVTDPSLAPKGSSTLYVLVPVPHQNPNVDWGRERDRFRSLAFRQLERIGLHGLERRVRVEKVVTPKDWEARYEIHLGATFNLAHNLGQMLHLRPHNRFEDVEGLYLVGGGTHPGSGLPVIFESARISTSLLLRDLSARDVPSFARAPRLQETAR